MCSFSESHFGVCTCMGSADEAGTLVREIHFVKMSNLWPQKETFSCVNHAYLLLKSNGMESEVDPIHYCQVVYLVKSNNSSWEKWVCLELRYLQSSRNSFLRQLFLVMHSNYINYYCQDSLLFFSVNGTVFLIKSEGFQGRFTWYNWKARIQISLVKRNKPNLLTSCEPKRQAVQ